MEKLKTEKRRAPRWMHGAIWLLPGVANFEHLEELLNDMSPVQVNAPLALTACAVKSQVDVLTQLVANKMLEPKMLVSREMVERAIMQVADAALELELHENFVQRMEYLEAMEVVDTITACLSTGRTPQAMVRILLRMAEQREVKGRRPHIWLV